jgi:hypothetical protein
MRGDRWLKWELHREQGTEGLKPQHRGPSKVAGMRRRHLQE